MSDRSPVLPDDWSPRTLTTLRRRLLSWFDRNHRKLPWRDNRDPYRIWVSEVMLQQTTVAAVIPYFERFLLAFPTISALTAADEQQVLALWSGLGYYRRARHLHAAAKQLCQDHGDQLPDDPEVWAELPGVGRYILGAVLSQAFDRPLPIVEANSLRVLSRLLAYRDDPRSHAGLTWAWSAAERLLPKSRTGDFNQAMMELGALVCTPRNPDCGHCPLESHCLARREGLQQSIPPPKAAVTPTAVSESAVVIRDQGKVLLCKRSSTAGRWQNMWEFPHGEQQSMESAESAATRIAHELTGLHIETGGEIMTIRHTITRFAITMTAFEAARRRGEFRSTLYSEARWLPVSELKDYAVSSPQRILIEELTRSHHQRRLF